MSSSEKPSEMVQEMQLLTWKTLNARTKNYRLAAYFILASTALTLMAALIARRPQVMLGLLLIPASVLAMVARDHFLVSGWAHAVLAIWRKGNFPLVLFAEGLTVAAGPLKNAVQSMVLLLPTHLGNLTPSPEVSDAVLNDFRRQTRKHAIRLGFYGAAFALIVGLVLALAW